MLPRLHISPLRENPVQSACVNLFKLKMQGKLVFIDGRFAKIVEPTSSVNRSIGCLQCCHGFSCVYNEPIQNEKKPLEL